MIRITLGAALLCAAVPSAAHDHSRPDLNGWFKSLQSKKGPCCDGSDYKRVENPDWEAKGGKYRVRLKGQWVDVPDEAVLSEPNKVGPPLVWPVEYPSGIQIRCFLPGAMT